jgi:outer membrane protein OmpA-like peptidoglycan-associated protein
VRKELSLLLILLFVSTNFFGQKVSIERTCFNTGWDEYGPRMVNGSFYCLSASFDEGLPMMDPFTNKPFSDLYLINGCKIDHARFNTWEFGEGTSMSSNFYDGPLTGDSTILFFTNNHGLESNVKLGVFYAYKNKGKWVNAIAFPFNSLSYNVSHPFYDAKTGNLYFASDKGNTEENQDLYVCSFDGMKFSEPKKINAATSSKNDMAPYFYHGVLYFTSNGHGSMGGYDLFKLKDDKVVSMGVDFNTIYDDLTIMFETDSSGYFATSRFSKGKEDDIVKFIIRTERESITPIDTVQQVLAVNSTPIEQLVAVKEQVDSLRDIAAKSGVSSDLFAFLDLALEQYKNDFPESFSDKSLEEINARITELKAIISLVNQQIDIEKAQSVTANNDNVSAFQNTPISINVLENDLAANGGFNKSSIDLDQSKPGIQSTLTTEQGTWSAKDGIVSFVSLPTFTGNAQITYTVSDNNGKVSNSASISVNVTPNIGSPIANNDVASTPKDTPVAVNVLSNDIAPNGSLDKLSIDLDPNSTGIQSKLTNTQGSWSVKDGKVEFTPINSFAGIASINYTVNDSNGKTSNQASLSVNVSTVNDNPIATNDVASTIEETPITIDVLQNDTAPNGLNKATLDLDMNTSGIQSSLKTKEGNWTSKDGQVNFTPIDNFNGNASINYAVNDNKGKTSNTASISVNVSNTGDAALANNDAATTFENKPLKINILSNDKFSNAGGEPTIDIDPTKPGIQSTLSTPEGTWTVNSGEITFTPMSNYIGKAQLSYTITDDNGKCSNVANVSINVIPQIEKPIANNDDAFTTKNKPVKIDVLSNDCASIGNLENESIDLNQDKSGIQSTISTAQGIWLAKDGNVTFSPINDFSGTGNINYTVNDSDGNTSNVATLRVEVSSGNDTPLANNDVASTPKNTPITVDVLANDNSINGNLIPSSIDFDTNTSGIQSTLTTQQGKWSVIDGNVHFVPAANFSGNAQLNYTVTDDLGKISNIASLSVNVSSQSGIPVANNDVFNTPEDTPITMNVLENDLATTGKLNLDGVDLDTNTPGIQTKTATNQGTWTVKGGNVTFEPSQNFTGNANLNYTVNDQSGICSNSASIRINVSSVNDAPIAINDVASTIQATPVTHGVTNNDSDADGTLDNASVDLDLNSAGIQTEINNAKGKWRVEGGQVTFQPASDVLGTATITYTVKDNSGAISNPANLTIEIKKPENATIANNVQANNDVATTLEDTPISFDVSSNDVATSGKLNLESVDLDPVKTGVQTSFKNTQGTWTVTNATVLFTPALNYNGNTAISYTISDKNGKISNSATLSINVNSVNDAPIANDDAASTNESTAVTFTVTNNDNDIDGTIDTKSVDLDVSKVGLQTEITNSQGVWTVLEGLVSFNPAKGFSGAAIIRYTIKDNNAAISNQATISVSVSKNTLAANNNNTSTETQPLQLDVINSIIDQSQIENIQFNFDSYEITPEYKTYLRGLSMLIKANPNWNIHLSGHTDNVGEDIYNVYLSEQRSISAKKFLVSCGVEAERLTYDFFGESKPVATNQTPEGRYKNRRVEIKALIKK